MNDRQRFRETCLFGNPDKIPLEPGDPRESTLAAWHRQGLPQNIHWRDYLFSSLDLPHEPPRPQIELGITFQMLPAFDETVLEHRHGHYVVQDQKGCVVEIEDQYDFSYLREAKDFVTRRWQRFPVENRADWEEKVKWRYTPDHPERFPADFEARCRGLRRRDYVLPLTIPGPFWQLREWCGFENLCMLLIQQPEFVQEMIDFWTDFVFKTLAPILEQAELDFAEVSEDMAYKMHTMISQGMTRRFLLPAWEKWIRTLKAGHCAVVSIDSDGYIAELIPLWVEAGFDHTWPVEVAAGNDIVAYRKRYGRQIAFGGGIDKRALAAGGAVMQAEVMRVVPPLIQQGGFIPGCDHGVPPDVSWPNYLEYVRLLARLTGWLR